MQLSDQTLEFIKKNQRLRNELQFILDCNERTLQRYREQKGGRLLELPALAAISKYMNKSPLELVTSVNNNDLHIYIKNNVDNDIYQHLYKYLGVESEKVAVALLNNPKMLTLTQINVLVSFLNQNTSIDEILHPYDLIKRYKAGYDVLSNKELETITEEYELIQETKELE